MIDASALNRELDRTGRVWLRQAISENEVHNLMMAMQLGNHPGARVKGTDSLFSLIRESKWVKHIASVWPNSAPVRVLSFNKSPESNWGVPWHQDRIIAVKDRVETPGFSNWSNKAGIWHCEPPLDYLDRMLFVRVHLDRNDTSNGAMEIALESHKAGLIASQDAASLAETCQTEVCIADPGDILILKMLTLHRSRPSKTTAPRKALRVDFAADPLPASLSWA